VRANSFQSILSNPLSSAQAKFIEPMLYRAARKMPEGQWKGVTENLDFCPEGT
jgi:hypothetical protein